MANLVHAYWIWQTEKPMAHTKCRKKKTWPRVPIRMQEKANRLWSTGFVLDHPTNRRQTRAFNVINGYSREIVL